MGRSALFEARVRMRNCLTSRRMSSERVLTQFSEQASQVAVNGVNGNPEIQSDRTLCLIIENCASDIQFATGQAQRACQFVPGPFSEHA